MAVNRWACRFYRSFFFLSAGDAIYGVRLSIHAMFCGLPFAPSAFPLAYALKRPWSDPSPSQGSYASVSAILQSHSMCVQTTGTTTASITVPSGVYYFNIIVQNLSGVRLAYTPRGEVANDSLVYYMPFEGNTNDVVSGLNLVPASYNSQTATTGQMTADRFGNANSARQFSGSDCLMTHSALSPSVVGNSNRVITFWVSPGVNPGSIMPLMIGGDGANLATNHEFGLYRSGANWSLSYYGGTISATAYQDSSGWTFFWLAYDGTYTGVYEFAVGGASANFNPLSTSVAPMFVGCGVDGASNTIGNLANYFHGAVDDIRVFSGSNVNINALYQVSHP